MGRRDDAAWQQKKLEEIVDDVLIFEAKRQAEEERSAERTAPGMVELKHIARALVRAESVIEETPCPEIPDC